LDAINILVGGAQGARLPKGFERFNMFARIGEAFEQAKTTKELSLEEEDYLLLRGIVEENIPAKWGMRKEIKEAFEIFMNAKPLKN